MGRRDDVVVAVKAETDDASKKRLDDLQSEITELEREFFQAFSTHGGITLHIDRLHGFNAHHITEAAFKAVARALRDAVETDPRKADTIPSTKGSL